MPRPLVPLTRELPTHYRDGRIKFAVVLSIARKSRRTLRSLDAQGRVLLAADRFTRVRDAMETVRTDVGGAAAFHAVTNVPVYFVRSEERRVGAFAWTEHTITGRITAEQEAAAKVAALEAALIRDAAPMREAA